MSESQRTGEDCAALNFTDKECFELDNDNYVTVFWIKTVVLIIAALACSLAIGMIVFFKAYKKFVHRIALYIVVAAFFNSLAFILNSLPVENRCGYMVVQSEGFCIATGFLDQYTTWVILLLVCWITLHIFMFGVLNRRYNSLKYEVGGVATILIVSLVSSIIPFIDFGNGTMYGLAGAWCWIRTTGENCEVFTEGVVEQFVLWYATVMFFVTLNFMAILAVIIVLYRKEKQTEGGLKRNLKDAIKEILPLLFYPLIFSVIYSLAFVNRVYYAGTKNTVVALWAIHAIAESSLPLFIPLAFLLHPYTLKMLNRYHFRKALNAWRENQREYTETHYVVSQEGFNEEEVDRLVIKGDSQKFETVSYMNTPN